MSRPAPIINSDTVGPLGLLPAEVLQLIFGHLSPIQQFKINVISDLRAIFNQSKIYNIGIVGYKETHNLRNIRCGHSVIVFLYTYCGMSDLIEYQCLAFIKENPIIYNSIIYFKYDSWSCFKYNNKKSIDLNIIYRKICLIKELLLADVYMDCYDTSVFVDIALYGYIDKWTEIYNTSFKTYQNIDLDINTNRDVDISNYDYNNPINRVIALFTAVLPLITKYDETYLCPEDKAVINHIFYRHFVRHDHLPYMYLFLFNTVRLYLDESGDVDSYYDINSDKSINALFNRFLKYYVCPDETISVSGLIYRTLINHREFISHLQYIFSHDTYKTHYRSWVKFIKITKETPNKLIPRLKAIHIALKLR